MSAQLLQRKLNTTWSSAEFASFLQGKPAVLSEVLTVYGTLDQAVKLRVLLAFLALEDISILPKELVLAVLEEAGKDADEWVKVCASLVGGWLFGLATGLGGPDSRPPNVEVAADVLSKCGLLAEANGGDAMDVNSHEGGGSARRHVDPEPHFCPMEYLYLSEPLIQRHHRLAPLTRRENAHFVVGNLKEVEMEPIPDSGSMPSPPTVAPPQPSLPAASSSSSLLNKPDHARPHPPPPPSTSAQATRPLTSSLLSRAGPLGQPRQQPPAKPRLKLIKLDEVKVASNQAKTAARNEAVSAEFGAQPLSLPPTHPKSAEKKKKLKGGTPPPPPPPPSFLEESKKRSAAEALAGLLAQPTPSPPPPPSAGNALTVAATSSDALEDYHRMRAKSNRLTPQDDERIRNFYMHGALGNPNPSERQVKIKINEEEQVKEDGSKVRETLYISLNYDSKKAVLSRKVSKPKG